MWFSYYVTPAMENSFSSNINVAIYYPTVQGNYEWGHKHALSYDIEKVNYDNWNYVPMIKISNWFSFFLLQREHEH